MRTQDRSNIYTTGKIGKTREVTPEGYLLCRDVAVARTGQLLYGKGEVPVTEDSTGLIIISREDDDLFCPKTIASFEGKPITNDHPDDWVNPENWKALSVGTAQNVRRGDGVEDHLLMADLLITDKQAIEDVQKGKIEISLGYDADYVETSVGRGEQRNIMGNHVALVDKGRCGSRCAIGDKSMTTKVKKKLSFADRIRALVKTKDADEAEKLAKAVEDEDLDIETKDDDPEDDKAKTGDAHFQSQILKFMKTVDSRLSKLEKTKDSDPPKDEETEDDDDDPTQDDVLEVETIAKKSEEGEEKHTGDSLKAVLACAEILSPGIKLPTLDARQKNIAQSVLSFKRQALKQAYQTADGQKVILPFTGGNTDFDQLPKQTIDTAFIGASELLKQMNNARGVRSGITTRDFGRAPLSVSEMNVKNREFWANRK